MEQKIKNKRPKFIAPGSAIYFKNLRKNIKRLLGTFSLPKEAGKRKP